jgi:hypothetical protein
VVQRPEAAGVARGSLSSRRPHGVVGRRGGQGGAAAGV